MPMASIFDNAHRTSARRRARLAAALALAGGALLSGGPAAGVAEAASAQASGFYIRGGGDGHGIGMSQYGALGLAQHGWTYSQILEHYYRGISLSPTDTSRTVTVLLKQGSAAFAGATGAEGKKLNANLTYTVRESTHGGLELTAPGLKKPVGPFASPLTVSGPGPLDLAGLGLYRGALVFHDLGGGQVETVNALDLEDYVRGVVSAEMPSGWPAAALEAQAVAARTYVLTSGSIGSDYDVYSDTRSQMYRGVAAETPSTDAAIAATRGLIATYDGNPATTYFSSSSGGYTEDIQNVWLGVNPEPWLQGVPDPYDNAGGNPYHRWQVHMSLRAAGARLGRLVRGSLVGIKVTRHGVSPRVVSARVVGSQGSVTVSGPELQQVFGLLSTYMSFTTIRTKASSPSKPAPAPAPSSPTAPPASSAPTGGSNAFSTTVAGPDPSSSSGGASIQSAIRTFVPRQITGSLYPAGRGVRLSIQQLERRGFVTVARARSGRGGNYAVTVFRAGTYRVLADGIDGPAVTLR
jgi:stage II sporulation protein D